MTAIRIIARKEFKSAFRNRIFLTITILFLALSILSVYIGSTTKRAEMRLYNERVAELTADGASTFPAAPEIHTLTILSNLTEYVAIVGAILAIVLGYNTLIDEKESGGLKLILSRPVYRDQLLIGKFLGNVAVIGVLLGLALIFNVVLLVMVGGIVPTWGEVLRLVALIGIAFVYISLFLIIAMTLSIVQNDSANVFLLALAFWMLVSFVIPQIAETQMANSTIINSINGVTNTIPQETTASRTINFLSPTGHLRNIGAELLEVTQGSAELGAGKLASDGLTTLFILLVPTVMVGAAGFVVFSRNETLVMD